MHNTQKIISAFTFMFCLFLFTSFAGGESLSSFGITENESDFVYHELSDDTIAVTGYLGTNTNVSIPSVINGRTVSTIERLYNNTGGFSTIIHLTIPETVTSIGDYAFSGSPNLTSISIPDRVTTIGKYAFSGCSNLRTITIPPNVTIIENGTFGACTNLVNVNFSGNITTIGEYAFSGCTSLAGVAIPSTVKKIEYGAFVGCDSLTDVHIPESVTSIGIDPFGWCNSLQEIHVAQDNPVYAAIDGLLYEKNTHTLIQYPTGKQDEEYTLPPEIEKIGQYAFGGCIALRSVILPNSMTTIGIMSFANCTSLERITIPNTVTRIEFGAFMNSGLKAIVIPDGVKALDGWVFMGCQNLTDVYMADSVIEMGDWVFASCNNLAKIKLSNNLTRLDKTFQFCTSLTQISVPVSVKVLAGTFQSCTALHVVILPDGLTEIGDYTFDCCSSLEALQLPRELRYIGRLAFNRCTALKMMDFTQSPALLAIDESAFADCTALTIVYLSDNMPSLGEHAFDGCEALKTVNWTHSTIPDFLVKDGEINYLPYTDRTKMIQMMARHAARQQGFTILPDIDSDGNITDKESWRDSKIDQLKQTLFDAREALQALQNEINNPETPENKKKALATRIVSYERTIEEANNSIAQYSGMQLLTDSEAQSMWETATHLTNAPECDIAIYVRWQGTFVNMQKGNNLPKGYTTLMSYLTDEDGLRYINADAQQLEHITNCFTTDSSGTVNYLPGPGTAGICAYAFSGCKALESVTIPKSVTQISDSAFTGTPSTITIITEPGSYAEEYCLNNNIHYAYPGI